MAIFVLINTSANGKIFRVKKLQISLRSVFWHPVYGGGDWTHWNNEGWLISCYNCQHFQRTRWLESASATLIHGCTERKVENSTSLIYKCHETVRISRFLYCPCYAEQKVVFKLGIIDDDDHSFLYILAQLRVRCWQENYTWNAKMCRLKKKTRPRLHLCAQIRGQTSVGNGCFWSELRNNNWGYIHVTTVTVPWDAS